MVISRSNSPQKSWILPKGPETRRKLPRRLRGSLQSTAGTAGAYRQPARCRIEAPRRSAMCKLDETIYILDFVAAPQSGGAYVFSCKCVRHNSTFMRIFLTVLLSLSPCAKTAPALLNAEAVFYVLSRRCRFTPTARRAPAPAAGKPPAKTPPAACCPPGFYDCFRQPACYKRCRQSKGRPPPTSRR